VIKKIPGLSPFGALRRIRRTVRNRAAPIATREPRPPVFYGEYPEAFQDP